VSNRISALLHMLILLHVIISPLYVNLPYHGKALNSLICADVSLRNCSFTHCCICVLDLDKFTPWSKFCQTIQLSYWKRQIKHS